jgi:hypothetical protein
MKMGDTIEIVTSPSFPLICDLDSQLLERICVTEERTRGSSAPVLPVEEYREIIIRDCPQVFEVSTFARFHSNLCCPSLPSSGRNRANGRTPLPSSIYGVGLRPGLLSCRACTPQQ